jgi:hypothetical protein
MSKNVLVSLANLIIKIEEKNLLMKANILATILARLMLDAVKCD